MSLSVITQQSLVERLRLIARQQGLECHVSGTDIATVRFESEMFFIDIVLNKAGSVREVNIGHQGENTKVRI